MIHLSVIVSHPQRTECFSKSVDVVVRREGADKLDELVLENNLGTHGRKDDIACRQPHDGEREGGLITPEKC